MERNKFKILLVNPPQTFYPGSMSFSKSFPVGLGYIAAVLDKEGYQVEVLDALTTAFESKASGDVIQHGMSFFNIEKDIGCRALDIVGISCPSTAQMDNTVKIAAIIKKVHPRCLVVVGGPHASVKPEDIMQVSAEVDITVIGEGEFTMLKIADAYCSGDYHKIGEIHGIAYRSGKEIVCNRKIDFIEPLDDLPFPAYHLFDMEEYVNADDEDLYGHMPDRRSKKHFRTLRMVTSRGCPFNCIFCSVHLHMGKKWRSNSVRYVIDHLKHVVANYGINYIHFDDDNLTLDKERFHEILDGIIHEKILVAWDTPNGVRADLSLELLKKAKLAGCHKLRMAVESGDQVVLDTIIDKKLALKDPLDMAKTCQELDLPLAALFVFGFPGETIDNMKNTANFARMLNQEYGVLPILMAATPLYGTRLYAVCQEKGYLVKDVSPRALSEGTQCHGTPLIKTEQFSPEDTLAIIASVGSSQNKGLITRILNKISRFSRSFFR